MAARHFRGSQLDDDDRAVIAAAVQGGASIESIRRAFGVAGKTVRGIVERAGIDRPRQSRRTLTDQERACMLDEIERGTGSRSDIARRYGVDPSYSTILAKRAAIRRAKPRPVKFW